MKCKMIDICCSVYQRVRGAAVAEGKTPPLLYKVSWAFYSTMYTAAILVTLVYWTAIYSGMMNSILLLHHDVIL